MSQMVPLETALARMVASLSPVAPRRVPLIKSDGCVLAQDCIARCTQPPFDVSAMDGYALAQIPVPGTRLDVIGEVPAGGMFTGTLAAHQAVRIFTGAPLPAGSRCVLIQEDAKREGETITICADPSDGTNIRPAGGNFAAGDTLLEKGTPLAPQHVALAASGNHADLLVHPRPRVAILMNGDELCWPGPDAPKNAIMAANGFGVAALVGRIGGEVATLDLLGDDQRALEAAIAGCTADLLITIGGASVGDYDLVRPALEARGFALSIPKVALRPGKPTLFGRRGPQTVMGLPGNPVSALVSAMIFLPPLLATLAGKPAGTLLPLDDGILGTDIAANGPRAHFMRARLDDTGHVHPVSSQDSSLLRLLADADALLYRHAGADAARTGAACQIMTLPR